MKRNTLSVKGYIIDTVFWAIIAFAWYHNLLFKNIDGKTVVVSNIILIAMVVFVISVNAILTITWNRTTVSSITTVLIPYGIYAYITYSGYIPAAYTVIVWGIIGACIITMIYILFVILNVNREIRRILRKARFLYSIFRFGGAAASVLLLVCLFCNVYLGGTRVFSNNKPISTYSEEYTVATNMEKVLLLQEEEWKKLSLKERMDVLQCICNIEGNYLGLNREIHIYASEMDENLLGYYDDSVSSIHISIDLVESGNPYETLSTVAHEMYHAGQARYVEIYESLDEDAQKSYFLHDASVYAEEFRNYKNTGITYDISDYLEYYDQLCEETARIYSHEAVLDYYSKINEYLNNSNLNLIQSGLKKSL